MNPQDVIYQEYKGSTNFMTPNVQSVEWIIPDHYAMEISSGKGFNHDLVVGVSIVSYENGETTRERELSGSFSSYKDARDYIKRIKKELEKEISNV